MAGAERFFVAILRMGTSVEQEAPELAADLGTTAYEERLKLVVGVPAIVFASAELAPAEALGARLRARGHGVHVCRASEVVASDAMTSLRRYQLDTGALVADAQRLPWSDVLVLVRAIHRRSVEKSQTVKEKKLAIGRAIATGGLMMRKKTEREVTTHTDDSEPVLYLFRRSGEPAWILRERGTNYAPLGAALTPTAARNFALLVELLRTHASDARFDDRLTSRKGNVADIDLLAHLVARETQLTSSQ